MPHSVPHQNDKVVLGTQFDKVIGLMYIDGRYYDPVTGRFLSPSTGGQNPYVPFAGLSLAPFILIAVLRRRKKGQIWTGWLIIAVMASVGLTIVACGGQPTPQPVPTTPRPITTPPTPTSKPVTIPPSVTSTPSPMPLQPTLPQCPTAPSTPSPTPAPAEEEVNALARMLYPEQLSEPNAVRTAAAWVVRNRVTTGYLGLTTYQDQVERGGVAHLTVEEANSLTGQDLQHFNDLLALARGVIDGSLANPMTDVPDAIFFANSSYSDLGQQTAYETLLDDANGCVGPGNWGYFE